MRLLVAVTASALMLCSFASVSECQETHHGRGFVPPSFAPHHVEASAPRAALPLPLRFDWRELGAVTPVKNQGSCGSCYAFAGLADLESKMLIAGEGPFDFSENNLKECEWFARSGLYPSGCMGGTYWRVINLMAEYGTVLEVCDPYLPYDATCNLTCPYVTTVLNWRVFSLNQVPSPDIIKAYVAGYGPVFAAIDAGYRSAWANELDDYDGSYTLYYPEQYQVNHSVLIVGWDDTLSHEGGQGAWICKNSWGTSWGGTAGYGTESGYFTIAYGSANIGQYAAFVVDWQDYDPCGRLLLYDEAGYYSQAGYGSVTAWGMCRFVLEEDAELERVEFWTTDATTDVDVYVYDDFSGSVLSNLLESELDNSFGEMGYHSVPLTTYLEKGEGGDIYVAVKLTNAAYTWPLTMDPQGVGPRAPGMCYMSADGYFWEEFDEGDLGIRLRIHLTRDCEPPDTALSFTAQGGDQRITLRWVNPADADFSHMMIRYSTSGYPLSPEAGTAVENGNDGIFPNMPGGHASFIHTDLERYETYCYSAFAADTVPNYSAASHAHAATDRRSTREVKISEPDTPLLQGEHAGRTGWRSRVGGQVEIRFSAGAEGSVRLAVYDVAGRLVRTLYHDIQTPGLQRVVWDGTRNNGARLVSGIYFIRIEAAGSVRTQKTVILR